MVELLGEYSIADSIGHGVVSESVLNNTFERVRMPVRRQDIVNFMCHCHTARS